MPVMKALEVTTFVQVGQKPTPPRQWRPIRYQRPIKWMMRAFRILSHSGIMEEKEELGQGRHRFFNNGLEHIRSEKDQMLRRLLNSICKQTYPDGSG